MELNYAPGAYAGSRRLRRATCATALINAGAGLAVVLVIIVDRLHNDAAPLFAPNVFILFLVLFATTLLCLLVELAFLGRAGISKLPMWVLCWMGLAIAEGMVLAALLVGFMFFVGIL